MAAGKTIGGINVTITATVDRLQRNLGIARKAVTAFSSSTRRALTSWKTFSGMLAGGVAAGAMVKFTSNAFQAVDAMGELSDKLGISTKHIKGLQLAASEAGVSNETLERSMVALNKNGMGGIDGLRQWIKQTSMLSTHQERLAATTKLFGTRGSDMIRMLSGGIAGLDDAQKRAERFGFALGRDAVAGVEKAMDAFGELKFALGGLWANVAVELSPFITGLTKNITSFLGANGRVKAFGSAVAQAMITAAKKMSDGIQSVVLGIREFLLDAKSALSSILGTLRKFPGMEGLPNLMEGGKWDAYRRARERLEIDKRGPRWSTSIERAMQAAKASVAGTADAGMSGPGVLRRIMGDAGRTMAEGLQQRFNAITNGPFAQFLKLYGKTAMLGMGRTPAAAMGMAGNPNLMLAESGSVESYRQQAAIRRQGEQIAKKHLAVGQQQLAELRAINKKTTPTFEANLA